jgi:choline kinase
MDVLILAAGLSSRLSKYTYNLIPKYLIDIDGNTGLYYLIKYWNNHATNIYLVIH